jgi:hypothetical protein
MRQIGRIALGRHMNALAVYDDVVAICLYFAGKRTMYAVALEEQCIGLCGRKVIDRNQLQVVIVALQNGARHKPSNAPEAVYSYLNRHFCAPVSPVGR